MIDYQFQVFIPSLGYPLFFREVTMRDWININKSIIGDNPYEIVNCFEQILLKAINTKEKVLFTLHDKIIILLAIRAFSIGNFSELNITDNISKSEFKYTLEINDLLSNLQKLPIKTKDVFHFNGMSVQYGVPLFPLARSDTIKCTDYIHCIYRDDEIIMDNINDQKEIQEIINQFDINLVKTITTYAKELNDLIIKDPLYTIKHPTEGHIVIERYMSFDFELYDFIKLLFTENLHALYKSIYQFNQVLHISPEYIESLPPVEKDLLWGYYLKEQKDAEMAKIQKSTNTFTT